MDHGKVKNKTLPPSLWKGQVFHLIVLTALLVLICWVWRELGAQFKLVFWITVSIPVIHQMYVWLCWRLELNYQAISNSIGFQCYKIVFLFIFLARPVSLIYLADLDQNSLGIPSDLASIVGIGLLIPVIYAAYSVLKYFGIARATGADHFFEKYRAMPFVKEGIFKYSSNAMYVFGFLALWAIAFLYNSDLGLLLAAFQHIYIWVHYYATEKPDIEYIYG